MKNIKRVAFITLGCKVNQYETNGMTQKLKENGYEIVNHNEKADIYIINTCTVTNMSDRKSRQMLRKTKEKNPDAKVIAVGCYAQVAKKELEKIEEIDLILGNEEKKDIVKYCEDLSKTNIELTDIMHKKEFGEYGDVTYSDKTRAVIKVQDGCDRFCSYCIIPYARGRVRSRKPENVVSEITKIAKKGIKEVVITGIHIASYGKDFKEKYELIDLLEEINKIDGIERIRLGSIEPLLITEEFIERLSKLDKICDHFHLSLQSGCNETLKRMNRRYTVEEFRKIVKIIRNKYENVNLTTDIIVGFPEETEEEFETTYNFLKEINFYKMHIFKYSQRKGTVAAKMKQIDPKIKEERSKKLIELSDKNEDTYNKKYIGKQVEVLWEEEKKGIIKGHTKNYILVEKKIKDNEKNKENTLENVIIKEEKEHYIIAKN